MLTPTLLLSDAAVWFWCFGHWLLTAIHRTVSATWRCQPIHRSTVFQLYRGAARQVSVLCPAGIVCRPESGALLVGFSPLGPARFFKPGRLYACGMLPEMRQIGDRGV